MTSLVDDEGPVARAYRELELASMELQRALVQCDSPMVAGATRKVADARAVVLDVTAQSELSPEERGYLRGVALRVSRINEANLVLIRRRISRLRQLRRELGDMVGTVGYGSDGGPVTEVNRR